MFLYLCAMTFKEKYKVFQNVDFVIDMITKSVYDTMHLEGQGLPKNQINDLVRDVMKEPEPKLKVG